MRLVALDALDSVETVDVAIVTVDEESTHTELQMMGQAGRPLA